MERSASILVALFTIEADSHVFSTSPADSCMMMSELIAGSPGMLPELPDPFGGCTTEETGT
jgi:hypothetical protein